jgi:hypothetical protein
MLRIVFTDAPDRLIYHQRSLVACALTTAYVLDKIERLGREYKSVRICCNEVRIQRALKGLMP